MTREEVILVDDCDRETGRMEKMRAHHLGSLHRAFSVFLFNEKGELLLQQRAAVKYHSAGLWTNTCCGHPRPGEVIKSAAARRLNEELGIQAPMAHSFRFRYRSELANGLTEHEIDHVFIGTCFRNPIPNPDEVQQWKYISADAINDGLKQDPANFTAWFRLVWPVVHDWINA